MKSLDISRHVCDDKMRIVYVLMYLFSPFILLLSLFACSNLNLALGNGGAYIPSSPRRGTSKARNLRGDIRQNMHGALNSGCFVQQGIQKNYHRE